MQDPAGHVPRSREDLYIGNHLLFYILRSFTIYILKMSSIYEKFCKGCVHTAVYITGAYITECCLIYPKGSRANQLYGSLIDGNLHWKWWQSGPKTSAAYATPICHTHSSPHVRWVTARMLSYDSNTHKTVTCDGIIRYEVKYEGPRL